MAVQRRLYAKEDRRSFLKRTDDKVDSVFLMLVLALLCVGLTMLYSASFAQSRYDTGYESSVKEMCQSTRKAYKARAANLSELFSITESDHNADSELLSPVISELVDAVKKFSEEFSGLKEQENGADFSDTLHLALKLLVEPDGDGYVRTPLALGLSENYAEILVDEYQDVNKAQDMIFSALSKDENNLFMVGDVKQSIYRFRQAMPEIFLARRDGMNEYDSNEENYPAKVTLGKNFRSRNGVTEIVNFIFSSLMSYQISRIVCISPYRIMGLWLCFLPCRPAFTTCHSPFCRIYLSTSVR
jgi:ATP-dependent helicase/nuclease subunit A